MLWWYFPNREDLAFLLFSKSVSSTLEAIDPARNLQPFSFRVIDAKRHESIRQKGGEQRKESREQIFSIPAQESKNIGSNRSTTQTQDAAETMGEEKSVRQ